MARAGGARQQAKNGKVSNHRDGPGEKGPTGPDKSSTENQALLKGKGEACRQKDIIDQGRRQVQVRILNSEDHASGKLCTQPFRRLSTYLSREPSSSMAGGARQQSQQKVIENH